MPFSILQENFYLYIMICLQKDKKSSLDKLHNLNKDP